MSDFKPGDRALLTVEVAGSAGTTTWVTIWNGDRSVELTVPSDHLEPAPEPPYVDPELVPGMVVAPLDETDKRQWFVRRPLRGGLLYVTADTAEGGSPAAERDEIADRIRVVFDPREVTS